MITQHAADRALERAGIADPTILRSLWAVGRPAQEHDFVTFGAEKRTGFCYRVAKWLWTPVLIVCSVDGNFVTVLTIQ